jgi:hypothetical protein
LIGERIEISTCWVSFKFTPIKIANLGSRYPIGGIADYQLKLLLQTNNSQAMIVVLREAIKCLISNGLHEGLNHNTPSQQ